VRDPKFYVYDLWEKKEKKMKEGRKEERKEGREEGEEGRKEGNASCCKVTELLK